MLFGTGTSPNPRLTYHCAAIMNSRNSSHGVDNIGNLVWKFGPPQFRSYLYNCLNSHLSGAPVPLHFNDGLRAFLPKGEQEDDGSAGPGCVEKLPCEPRPLTMKNTDNKIITAAVNYAAIPTFKDTVNKIQQGFVPGRNFVGNVVQLDFESRVNASRCLNNRNVANSECMLPPARLPTLLVLFRSISPRPSPRCSKHGSSLSYRPFRPLKHLLIPLSLCIRRIMHTQGARGD